MCCRKMLLLIGQFLVIVNGSSSSMEVLMYNNFLIRHSFKIVYVGVLVVKSMTISYSLTFIILSKRVCILYLVIV